MKLKRLRLYQFRNYEKADVSFAPRLNVLIGANGAGKTNFLEAIYLASRFKSFRTHSLAAIAKDYNKSFSLKLDFAEWPQKLQDSKQNLKPTAPDAYSNAKHSLEWIYHKGTQTFKLNDKPCLPKTLQFQLSKRPNVILFTPNDTLLIQGGPVVRRAFMDKAIGELNQDYQNYLETYNKALRNRNRQLKQGKKFKTWDEALVRAGVTILKMRENFMQELASYAKLIFLELSQSSVSKQHESELSLAYSRSSLLSKNNQPSLARQHSRLSLTLENYQTLLSAHEMHDKRRKYTVFGPHSDDLVIKLRKQEAKHYASQGESRTLAHALKLSVFKMWIAKYKIRPVLLLDDIFSDLDELKLKQFMHWVQQHAQTVLTCAQPQLLLPYAQSGEVFKVAAGGKISVH